MPDMKEAAEALDTATKAVKRMQSESHDVADSPDLKARFAIVATLDAVAAIAKIVGVPNAIEP